MSDELKRILESPAGRPASSRPSISPRVRGGPPLEGAPKFEGDPAMSDDPNLDNLVSVRPEMTKTPEAPAVPAADETIPTETTVASEEIVGAYVTVPAEVVEPTVQRIDGPHLATNADAGAGTCDERAPASEQVEQVGQAPSPSRLSRVMQPTVQYRLACMKLKKGYRKANVEIPVLTDVSLGVREGEFLAIVGQSGSGKSTLLHLLGTLDSPDEGEICFDGQRIDNLPAAFRDTLRNEYFGMIFQFYHLLPELTTLENVLSPLMIGESIWSYLRRRKEYRQVAAELLETVGLGHRLTHKPRELSGGEMQRAAIARALVTSPDVLLADEPTGNLDRESGGEILDLLDSLNRRRNLTIVMVTHDPAIADRADRIVRLTDGRIEAA